MTIRNRVLGVLAALVLTSACGGTSPIPSPSPVPTPTPPGPTTTVGGIVFMGTPAFAVRVPGAIVQVVSPASQSNISTVADERGHYTLTGITVTAFIIKATYPSYGDATQAMSQQLGSERDDINLLMGCPESGCPTSGPPTPPPQGDRKLTSLTVTKDGRILYGRGVQHHCIANYSDKTSQEVTKEAKWFSSAPPYADVDPNQPGWVIGKQPGNDVYINCEWGGKKGQLLSTVYLN